MKRILFSIVVGGFLMGEGVSVAAPIKAIVNIGEDSNDQVVDLRGVSEGQVWYGPSDANKFGFYPEDIRGVTFDTREDIDEENIKELMKDRDYEEIIYILEKGIAPYEEYFFLPSNLSAYQAMLMELYYKTEQYEKSLIYSRMLAAPDRDPEWPARCDERIQHNAYAYLGLALMELKRVEEAEALFAARGWTRDLADDAPAEDLYITAKFLKMNEDYKGAIEVAAKVVAFNPDSQWLRPAELLCAELYADLGMFYSSEEVIRQIQTMYADTDEADQASELSDQMDDLREAWLEKEAAEEENS